LAIRRYRQPAKEYARLSGEIDAIQRAATTGNCAD
jgi:hypothetical protein